MKFKNICSYAKIGILLLIAALFIPLTAQADVNQWTQMGIYGGDIRALAIDPQNPSIRYIGTIHNIFKSIDGGNTWTAVNAGLRKHDIVSSLAIDPQNPSIIYAGTSGEDYGVILKSIDDGNSWYNIGSIDMGTFIVNTIIIDPQTPSRLFIGTNKGIFMSNDGGNSWFFELTEMYILSLALDLNNPSIIYAGTYAGGVFKSTDHGIFWSAVNTGLSSMNIRALAINPQISSIIYAATDGGVFKSVNSGDNWTNITNMGLPIMSSYLSLNIDPQNSSTLYTSTKDTLYKSMNSGASWAGIYSSTHVNNINFLTIDSQNSCLYMGTDQGFFKSYDSGYTWIESHTGITALLIRSLRVDPQMPSVLYAATGQGVFKSTDSGGNWTSFNDYAGSLDVLDIAVNPQTPSTLYAGTYGKGLFKSVDSGATWNFNGMFDGYINSLCMDPITPSTLYASYWGHGIYKTTDSGFSWSETALKNMYVQAIAIDPINPSVLYFGVYNNGVLKTVDGGNSFINSGLTGKNVLSLVIDPQTPSTLYAGTENGIFKSIDGGDSWSNINPEFEYTSIYTLAIDPQAPYILYAGTWQGLFQSTDSGKTWFACNNGLENIKITCLAINPQNPTILYAGAESFGAFKYEYEKYVISGIVTYNYSALASVTLDGLPGNPVTDASGAYLAMVPYGWSGTVTPAKSGYMFMPVNQSYNNVLTNQSEQNYSAALSCNIYGTVSYNSSGLAGVTLAGFPDNPVTDASGAYLAMVPSGWSGTVTPTKSGYMFMPVNQSYNNVLTNQSEQNYDAALATYTIAGRVTHNGMGLAGVTMNGLPGNPTTDTSGFYSTSVMAFWSGTVIPALPGFTFLPVQRHYNNVISNKTEQNYTATVTTFYISGRVTYNGGGLAGVTLNGLPGNPLTNISGYYSASVPYGWSSSVTPSKTGYIFSPVSANYNNVTSAKTDNYTATLLTYTIAGRITYNGTGLAGVTLYGLPGSTVTNASGIYSATVTSGWSSTATPSLNGYTFTPANRTYSNVTSDQTGQDYTATALTYTISGIVTYNGFSLAGVTLDGLPGNPVTDTSGAYAVTAAYGWSGTVTPVLDGYVFTPANRTYSNLTANQTGQNYTAALMAYTISGIVTHNGSGLVGVKMSGLPNNPVTNASGAYSATVTHDWSGTATPTKSGYTFTPVDKTYSNITANQTGQDYTATQWTYTISGMVTHNGSGLAGVTIDGLPGNPVTNSSGAYSATVTYGWSGIATPTVNGYTFLPAYYAYNNVTASQNAQDFTATLMTLTVWGVITKNGSELGGVILNGLPGNPQTAINGYYTATVPYGWSGSATPTLNGHVFSPVSRSYSNMASNQTWQDYSATILTYTISGVVTLNGSGLAGVTVNGLPGNPVTDAAGAYSASVTYGWSGTVTPTLAGYIFAPISKTYNNVTANQTGQDFTATLMTYTVSGAVSYNGSGLAGVTLNGLPGNPVTNASGVYSATVTYGWNGTATPTLNGYTFMPVSRSYNNVSANQPGQDYTATQMTYTISGSITRNGSGILGVVLNGLPGNPVTDGTGTYSVTVSHGWNGTAAPALNGYTFTPVSRTYNNVTSDQIAQNYAATQLTYTISGRATYNGSSLANVILNGLPGNPVTNSSGNYTATVPYGWSGTAMPTRSGYAFTPVSRAYNNVTSNQTGQNFTATLTYTISGRVTYNGSGLAGVTLSGLPGNPVTNASGNYSAIVPRGWSGTVRPILSGYTFSPTRRTYSNVTSNKTSQNYAAYH